MGATAVLEMAPAVPPAARSRRKLMAPFSWGAGMKGEEVEVDGVVALARSKPAKPASW